MKNKVIFSIMVSLVLISCGGGGNDPAPAPEPKNTAPTVPLLITPVANKLCISNIVSFEWGVSIDAEKNPIVYQLQIATDNQFAQIVSTSEISNLTQTVTLEKGKAYYWRVKAIDSKNASSAYSSSNSFYTEGVAVSNHIPFIPQMLSPTNNSTISGTSTTLKWSGSDVDVNDVLSFDVYLGTEANPTTKIVDNKTVTSYDATLQATKIYYWKVVVRDNKGGETNGQIWSFKTN
jgi:hypothetical protein